MLQTLMVATRDRSRLAEIAAVAARFGLDGFLARLGIGKSSSAEEPADLPNRVRLALEELGPTYIKLGQILATRRDILTDDWVRAFEQLQSGAPTLPFEQLRKPLEEALGEPIETAFLQFNTVPLAAASVAQVHRATLTSGQEVVVKIRRPDIRTKMEADLRLIRHLAMLAEHNSAEVRRFKPQALVEQLARDILDELDFTREGQNADALRRDFAGDDRIIVPFIHWQWTSESVLVMDFIHGVPPRDPAMLRAAGIDPAAIARLGAELVLSMVLVHGRFHGDPHPGNLLCLEGNRLALLDLGSVGVVSPRRQHEFLTFIVGLRSGSALAIADMLALWSHDVKISRDRIVAASERLVARHGSGPLVLDAMIADMFPMLRQEGLVLPPDLLLMFKALMTIDGVLSRIEPDFDLAHALQDMRGELVAARFAGFVDKARMQALMLELLRVAEEAPHFLRSAANWLDHQPSPPSEPAPDHRIRNAAWLISGAILIHAGLGFWAQM
jgi:ubiquinone biosynthesis protein